MLFAMMQLGLLDLEIGEARIGPVLILMVHLSARWDRTEPSLGHEHVNSYWQGRPVPNADRRVSLAI